jgi:tRNA (cytidine/uridine-2'-O-)-methyltransferase
LIRPLGFSLEDRHVKRAGLDYWQKVRLHVWDDFDQFLEQMRPDDDQLVLLTKNGRYPHWGMPSPVRLFLIFGSETKGLPNSIVSRYLQRTYCIPVGPDIRCLNLSTAVGIALYESLRFETSSLSL